MDGQLVYVSSVNHAKLEIETGGMSLKASLNAPLLDRMFRLFPDLSAVVHYHEQVDGIPTLGYAPPGTARDSNRCEAPSFNIEGHGCYIGIARDGTAITKVNYV